MCCRSIFIFIIGIYFLKCIFWSLRDVGHHQSKLGKPSLKFRYRHLLMQQVLEYHCLVITLMRKKISSWPGPLSVFGLHVLPESMRIFSRDSGFLPHPKDVHVRRRESLRCCIWVRAVCECPAVGGRPVHRGSRLVCVWGPEPWASGSGSSPLRPLNWNRFSVK